MITRTSSVNIIVAITISVTTFMIAIIITAVIIATIISQSSNTRDCRTALVLVGTACVGVGTLVYFLSFSSISNLKCTLRAGHKYGAILWFFAYAALNAVFKGFAIRCFACETGFFGGHQNHSTKALNNSTPFCGFPVLLLEEVVLHSLIITDKDLHFGGLFLIN